MKKLIASILVFATLSAILLSCKHNANLAITKRHYRNGYYVEHRLPVKKFEVNEAKAEQPVKQLPDLEAISLFGNRKNLSGTIASENKAAIKQKNSLQSIHSIAVLPTKASKKITPDKVIEKVQIEKQNNYSDSRMELLKRSSGGGHSLVWVIIIVLLVLWALSYFMGGWGIGAGWLSLLIVLAVVLLILKLLGVI
ncbi:MAG: hypothetical protein IT235_07095 [Bacteroidia bacterium]|nr:hypothetical protein [Bacteroidia bacterium]